LLKRNIFGLTNNGSSSAKSTLYVNKTKNIDYSEYFKINNEKSEKKIKIKNRNLNDFNRFTVQARNYHTNINSSKNVINTDNNKEINSNFDIDINSIKNIENKISNGSELKNLYINKNIYNTFYNSNSNLVTYQKINKIINNEDIENDIKKVYNNTGVIINNDINNNMNKIKKEEELSKLKKILKDLETKNKEMQTELELLKNKNLKLKKDPKNISRIIYLDIKNIFNNNIKDIKTNNNNQINIYDLFNFYKFKFNSCSSLIEKIEHFRKVYLDEKLKNSLIEKVYSLFLKNNLTKDIIINGDVKNKLDNINMDDIWKSIITIIGDIDKIKKFNNEMEANINDKKIENNLYKLYYNNWQKIFGVKKKEELRNKITDLINDQNYNDSEEFKLYKILMNKKP